MASTSDVASPVDDYIFRAGAFQDFLAFRVQSESSQWTDRRIPPSLTRPSTFGFVLRNTHPDQSSSDPSKGAAYTHACKCGHDSAGSENGPSPGMANAPMPTSQPKAPPTTAPVPAPVAAPSGALVFFSWAKSFVPTFSETARKCPCSDNLPLSKSQPHPRPQLGSRKFQRRLSLSCHIALLIVSIDRFVRLLSSSNGRRPFRANRRMEKLPDLESSGRPRSVLSNTAP